MTTDTTHATAAETTIEVRDIAKVERWTARTTTGGRIVGTMATLRDGRVYTFPSARMTRREIVNSVNYRLSFAK